MLMYLLKKLLTSRTTNYDKDSEHIFLGIKMRILVWTENPFIVYVTCKQYERI